MAEDDVPFDRSMPTRSTPTQVSPLVRRLIANNGGPFTFTGTCSYIVGHEDVTVIDPGPVDRMHRDALLATLGGARVKAILVTHTHRDHSPGALDLKAITGAPILGCAPPRPLRGQADGTQVLDASHDATYAPDTVVAEGDTIEGPDYKLTALATPGHTTNHLAYALAEEHALFSGDHVMAWSTTVIAPPDGSMRAFMASLEKLTTRNDAVYWPGHGGPVGNPQRFVRALAHHRRQREASILGRLKAGDETVTTVVRAIYENLAPALRGAAALTVLAHLEDLTERGIVEAETTPGLVRYRALVRTPAPSA